MSKIFQVDTLSLKLKSRHQELKTSLPLLLTAPVIYSLIVPALILDFFASVYQKICFPVYGIPKVNRNDYIKNDRHRLKYLNSVQKVNCAYCAYFNGLIAYVREIASRTEQYWCPIKHAITPKERHARYQGFVPYGDKEALEREWELKRKTLSLERD